MVTTSPDMSCVALIHLPSPHAARELFEHLAGGRQTYLRDDYAVFPVDAEAMTERLGYVFPMDEFFCRFARQPACECRLAREAEQAMEYTKWL